jgi:hypothetical protein
MDCKWKPCATKGLFGECYGAVVCDKAKAMAKVEVGEVPKLTHNTNPCGFKGLFGECHQTFEVKQTCPDNKTLKDGLCYTKNQ